MNDTTEFAARRGDFRALHQQGCFLLPNPWDIGGAGAPRTAGFQGNCQLQLGPGRCRWAVVITRSPG